MPVRFDSLTGVPTLYSPGGVAASEYSLWHGDTMETGPGWFGFNSVWIAPTLREAIRKMQRTYVDDLAAEARSALYFDNDEYAYSYAAEGVGAPWS